MHFSVEHYLLSTFSCYCLAAQRQAKSARRGERQNIENQVDGEIDEGKGDAGDAVEPEAKRGGQVSPSHYAYVVVVLEFVSVKADEELHENFYLRRA